MVLVVDSQEEDSQVEEDVDDIHIFKVLHLL